MQEEIEHKTVNFAISTAKLSARTLLRGAQFFLRQYDKSASQGKQSMKRLIRQNRGVTNLEIEKTGIKDFDRYAKRYHIDYAIQKDLSCTLLAGGKQVLSEDIDKAALERGIPGRTVRDAKRELGDALKSKIVEGRKKVFWME